MIQIWGRGPNFQPLCSRVLHPQGMMASVTSVAITPLVLAIMSSRRKIQSSFQQASLQAKRAISLSSTAQVILSPW